MLSGPERTRYFSRFHLFINAAHELPFAKVYGSFVKHRSSIFPKGTCGTTHNECCRDPSGTRYFARFYLFINCSSIFPKGTCGTTHNECCRDPIGTRSFSRFHLFINAAHELPSAKVYGSFVKHRSSIVPKGTCGTTPNEVCRDPNGTRYLSRFHLFINSNRTTLKEDAH